MGGSPYSARRRSTPSACFSSAHTNAAQVSASINTTATIHTTRGTSSTRRTRGSGVGGGSSSMSATIVGRLRTRQGSVSLRVLGSCVGLAVMVLLLSAAQGHPVVQVEIVAGGVVSLVALWALAALKKLYDKLDTVLDGYPDMQTALWGPRDATGNRPQGGLVRQTQEILVTLDEVRDLAQQSSRAITIAEDAKLVATTSADAVKHLQQAVRKRAG